MQEEIQKIKVQIKELDKKEADTHSKLTRHIIDTFNRMNEMDLRVNTLLDQAETLLGLKEEQGGSEALDAKKITLKTLVDAVNALRAEMREIREIMENAQ